MIPSQTVIFKTDEDHLNDTYTAKATCIQCNQTSQVTLPGPGLFKYNQGAFVYQAFPDLTAAQRELFFMSGICDECWQALFAPEEDDS